MILSIVVIGRNEGLRLRSCLESVLSMSRGNWTLEVVYVDSGSSDGSVQLAEALGVRTIPLSEGKPTAAAGRNAGWTAASGEFVLFLDGDTMLHPDFVERALPAFADPQTAVVWGHRRELHPRQSIYVRVMDLDWIYVPGWTAFCGGDALMRRSVLQELGGFDPTLIAGEEPELCRRILDAGYRILHVDLPMTGHDLAIRSFTAYWQRGVRAGHAFAEVAARFAGTATPFWTAEVRRNRVRALALLALGLAGVAGAFWSLWMPLGAGAVVAALVLRTAWKAHWKTEDRVGLLLYGVHSQLGQIPIFWGQVRFWLNRRREVKAGLVEYRRG